MKFSQVISLTLGAATTISASPFQKRQNSTEKRYAILDNDWSPAGFIPFLMALDAGIEVLALTSCKSRQYPNPEFL